MASSDEKETIAAELRWRSASTPSEPRYIHEAPPEIESAVLACLPSELAAEIHGDVTLRCLSQLNGPGGRYLLTTDANSWFVRVTSRWVAPQIEEDLTRFLFQRGVSVNPLLVAGATLTWEGREFRVDVRPAINGRHFNGSQDDLEALGTEVAACHEALRSYPRASEIRDAARVRFERHAEILEAIRASLQRDDFSYFLERAHWAVENRMWLGEMCGDYDPRLDQESLAQCVHGELHDANVLFDLESRRPVLIDFEESVHLHVPVSWDVAFIVHRFCLRDDPKPASLTTRLEAFARGYGALPKLAFMMRNIAWTTLLTVIDLRLRLGIISPPDEWDKFAGLELQARSLEGRI